MNFLSHLLASPSFLLRRHLHDDVRHAALIPVGAAHGRRPDALHARAFVHIRFGHEQLVDVHVVRCGSRRWRWPNRSTFRTVGAMRLLVARRMLMRVARPAGRGSGPPPAAPSAARFGCIWLPLWLAYRLCLLKPAWPSSPCAAFTEWPLNVRVGENSPSLCPTMFSVMYTGMNFLPLCTATRVADELRQNGRAPRPGAHHFLLVAWRSAPRPCFQMVVGERSLS